MTLCCRVSSAYYSVTLKILEIVTQSKVKYENLSTFTGGYVIINVFLQHQNLWWSRDALCKHH